MTWSRVLFERNSRGAQSVVLGQEQLRLYRQQIHFHRCEPDPHGKCLNFLLTDCSREEDREVGGRRVYALDW